MKLSNVSWMILTFLLFTAGTIGLGQSADREPVSYLKTTEPQRILPDAQQWEGDQQPHTLSVVKLNRGGFKYWGWYGLNQGRGIGLARSNDLVHWTKYVKNPLWLNARWPSVLDHASPTDPKLLYFAITRDYDTPTSYIVLATSRDGIHLKQLKSLVEPVANQRNQNPNLFHDPVSGLFYLTFYRGNDNDYFDIVSKSAKRIEDLDVAPEKILMHSSATVAAPTLLYVSKGGPGGEAVYFLATEVYPNRYSDPPQGEWQTKVFAASKPDGDFEPVAGNPIFRGERACLFQHTLDGRYYGYMSHLEHPAEKWVMEEVDAPLH